jgi:hypothetical protein
MSFSSRNFLKAGTLAGTVGKPKISGPHIQVHKGEKPQASSPSMAGA